MQNALVKYETTLGEVELSPETIRKYLVNGDGNVSDQEVFMFLNLCKYQKLNPFLREAYLIKYGSQPATIVTGKETFLKRASRNPKYRGHQTGISENGKTAWAEVYVDGYVVPIRVEVDWSEYVGKKKDGTITRMWNEKGRTMLKKVALVQALREAFPEDFGGLYSPEEINTIEGDALPKADVKVVDPKKPQTETLKDKLKGSQGAPEPEQPPIEGEIEFDLEAEKQAFEEKCHELALSPEDVAAFKKFLFRKKPTAEELHTVNEAFVDRYDEFEASRQAA
jgi:phage recombination protein Bet